MSVDEPDYACGDDVSFVLKSNKLFDPYIALEEYNKKLKMKNKTKVKPIKAKKAKGKPPKKTAPLKTKTEFTVIDEEDLNDRNFRLDRIGSKPVVPDHTNSLMHSKSTPQTAPATTSTSYSTSSTEFLPAIRQNSGISQTTYDSSVLKLESVTSSDTAGGLERGTKYYDKDKDDMNYAYLSSVNTLSITYKKDKITLENRNKALQTKVDNLQAKVMELKSVIKTKDEKLTQLRKSLEVYMERDERILKILSLYDSNSDNISPNQQISILKSECKELSNTIYRLRVDLSNERIKNKELENGLNEKDEQINELKRVQTSKTSRRKSVLSYTLLKPKINHQFNTENDEAASRLKKQMSEMSPLLQKSVNKAENDADCVNLLINIIVALDNLLLINKSKNSYDIKEYLINISRLACVSLHTENVLIWIPDANNKNLISYSYNSGENSYDIKTNNLVNSIYNSTNGSEEICYKNVQFRRDYNHQTNALNGIEQHDVYIKIIKNTKGEKVGVLHAINKKDYLDFDAIDDILMEGLCNILSVIVPDLKIVNDMNKTNSYLIDVMDIPKQIINDTMANLRVFDCVNLLLCVENVIKEKLECDYCRVYMKDFELDSKTEKAQRSQFLLVVDKDELGGMVKKSVDISNSILSYVLKSGNPIILEEGPCGHTFYNENIDNYKENTIFVTFPIRSNKLNKDIYAVVQMNISLNIKLDKSKIERMCELASLPIEYYCNVRRIEKLNNTSENNELFDNMMNKRLEIEDLKNRIEREYNESIKLALEDKTSGSINLLIQDIEKTGVLLEEKGTCYSENMIMLIASLKRELENLIYKERREELMMLRKQLKELQGIHDLKRNTNSASSARKYCKTPKTTRFEFIEISDEEIQTEITELTMKIFDEINKVYKFSENEKIQMIEDNDTQDELRKKSEIKQKEVEEMLKEKEKKKKEEEEEKKKKQQQQQQNKPKEEEKTKPVEEEIKEKEKEKEEKKEEEIVNPEIDKAVRVLQTFCHKINSLSKFSTQIRRNNEDKKKIKAIIKIQSFIRSIANLAKFSSRSRNIGRKCDKVYDENQIKAAITLQNFCHKISCLNKIITRPRNIVV